MPMATITYDGQSFIIDGKRIWLVSGAIHYPRIPHELWRSRIRAARQAGLNCIETYVFWNLHEPQPGKFRFEGDADLRRFVQIIGEEGMYCILRPGPFVCSEWDFGGLPAWLSTQPGVALRQANPPYMQAVARYFDAVMKQVADLQITSTRPGPIILVQNENEWFCHNPQQEVEHLRELSRYMRESGCEVPLINCNNFWQRVEGTIDCWNGWRNLPLHCRQLRVAQPDAPRLVTELWTGWFDAWGQNHSADKSPDDLLRTLAEVSGTGAQYNLYMFHGGTNFAFWGGRTVGSDSKHMITSYDYDAPLLEAGGRGPKYQHTKRISMFLSQFAQLMASLEPDDQPTVARAKGEVSLWQQSGQAGRVIFLTREAPCRAKDVTLLTPDGKRLTVHMGKDSAAWVVLDAPLGGAGRLDATNLRPWAFVQQKMLVLFGPAGTDGLVSIDDALLNVTVPKGAKPLVEQHQGLTIAVLNESQIDAAYIHDDGRLFIGIDGFDDDDQPLRGASGTCIIISPDGQVTNKRLAPSRKLTSPRLGSWQQATQSDYVDGTAPRFAAIDGPRALESCGADYGYGWYRLLIRSSSARKLQLLAPQSADRLHLYEKGKFKTILGVGPGASDSPIDWSTTKGEHELVFLADNLGRYNYGRDLGERKGLFGHLYAVTPLKLPKPAITQQPAADPFALSGMVLNGRRGDRTVRARYTFTIDHRKSLPLILQTRGDRPGSVVLINDQPIYIDPGMSLTHCELLEVGKQLTKGKNQITLALIDNEPEGYDPAKTLTIYEGVENLTEKAAWAYARWQMPGEDRYEPLAKSALAQPMWFKSQFNVSHTDAPLWLEINGMTKGQIYLNGHNIGRYFVATSTGKQVPPQSRYYLPEPWLKTDGANDLVLFDEHGRQPGKCRLVYDAMGPFNGK